MTDKELNARLREIQGQAGLFASAAAARIEALEAKQAKAVEALQWCSGSADFNEGGVAREGWLKVCAPLLKGESHD